MLEMEISSMNVAKEKVASPNLGTAYRGSVIK